MAYDQDQLPADNKAALRRVARACRKASLGTLKDGAPYVSLVTVAFDVDLAPIMLLSGLADHTRNLNADDRASLLLDGTDGHANPQTGPRVTLTGRVARCDDGSLLARFLGRHPGAARYAGFGDFAIWRMTPERAHFVGGFGRAVWFDAPFGLRTEAVAAVRAGQDRAVLTANGDHTDALARMGADWRVASLDCDGADLTDGAEFRRLAFAVPVDDPAGLRTALAESMRGVCF